MKQWKPKKIWLGTCFAAALGFLLIQNNFSFAQTYPYIVEDLGAPPNVTLIAPRAINQAGEVAGGAYISSLPHAFRYTNSLGFQDLGAPAGNTFSTGWDINDNGDIAAAGGPDPYWYSTGVAWTFVGSLGGSGGEAYAINDSGQIVGYSNTSAFSTPHGFFYDPNSIPHIVDLTPGTSAGYTRDVNNFGQATGYLVTGSGYRAFRWENGVFQDLGPVTGYVHVYGFAINDSGQVAGYASSATGDATTLVRYTDGVGWEILGGVGQQNSAWGINSRGDVVGQGRPGGGILRAVLYTDARGLQDLNELVDPAEGWFFSWAFDINDAGQIVVTAFNNLHPSVDYLVRLTPTPRIPQAIPDLTIVQSGSDAELSWSPVTADTSGNPITITRYVIYASPNASFVPAPTDSVDYVQPPASSYTDFGAVDGIVRFYNVKAVAENP